MENEQARSPKSLAVERQWQDPGIRKRRARAIRRAMTCRAVRRRIAEGMRQHWARKRAARQAEGASA